MKKRFLFISCEEAKHICDKSQYGEATIWEKLELNLRFVWCRVTKAYVKRNQKLTSAVKKANVKCLDNNEKNDLKFQLEQELKNK
jgi:O-acetyl-ADP-ribose deacetylase (regulator of RNase III)